MEKQCQYITDVYREIGYHLTFLNSSVKIPMTISSTSDVQGASVQVELSKLSATVLALYTTIFRRGQRFSKPY